VRKVIVLYDPCIRVAIWTLPRARRTSQAATTDYAVVKRRNAGKGMSR
jgi:hypothetical protein